MLHRLTRRLLPFVLAATAFTGLVLPTGASGAPIDDKRAQAAQIQQQIDDASAKLGALNEQINDAQLALDAANAAIADADAKVEAAKARTNELKQIVADRAVSLYTRSGSDATVDDLDTTRATDLTAQQKYASVAAQRDDDAMYQLKKSQEDLAVRKADAVQARDAASAQQAQLASAQADLNAGKQKLQSLKNNVDGEIADMIKQAEAARIAQEQAAAAAQQKAAQAQAAVQVSIQTPTGGGGSGSGSGGGSGGGSATNSTWTPPATSGRVGAVMAYAYAQLGKPYCYAGAGPDCFDCSGLTMMAWGQAGLSLPHGSYAQLAMFPSVPMSQLQVGDLVYWPDHVGIYVGGGAVLHAPHTGTVVQITPIWSGVIGANRPS